MRAKESESEAEFTDGIKDTALVCPYFFIEQLLIHNFVKGLSFITSSVVNESVLRH